MAKSGKRKLLSSAKLVVFPIPQLMRNVNYKDLFLDVSLLAFKNGGESGVLFL